MVVQRYSEWDGTQDIPAVDANEAHRIALRPVALAMLAPLPAEEKKPAPDAKGRR